MFTDTSIGNADNRGGELGPVVADVDRTAYTPTRGTATGEDIDDTDAHGTRVEQRKSLAQNTVDGLPEGQTAEPTPGGEPVISNIGPVPLDRALRGNEGVPWLGGCIG